MVEVAGGSPSKYIKQWHANGVKVLHKSATIRHALKAQAAGVDLIEVDIFYALSSLILSHPNHLL